MKTMTKALTGTLAAAAMAVSSASPAAAQDRGDYRRGGDGVSAGEVIAGALVIGGIAAVAASAGNRNGGYANGYNRDYRYGRAGYVDNRRYDDRYDRGYNNGNPRQAIEQCVRTAERDASRHSYGRADVTDIRSVRETRWGYEVRGRIAVNSNGRDWRRGDGDYGRGWGGDYRGWNNGLRGYDSGSFTCKVERGRITDLDYSGIRGL